MTVDDQYKRSALDNLTAALDFKKKFPDQVFSVGWGDFGFFESDRMFVGRFVTALHGLLAVEGGTSACLTNLSARRSSSDAEVVSWFMDTSTTEAEFITKLRGDGPASGWLFGMDQYACVSDVGRWCIYCEKENDVAVIAFRDETGGCDFSQPLTDLHASPADQIGSDPSVPFPLNNLTYAWHEALKVNYAALRANDDETATTRKFNLMTE